MNRREVLKLLGGTVVVAGLTPSELMSLGDVTHRRIRTDLSPLGFFDSHQMHTVAVAGERIIPATDTPGALAAECHRFTERIVADHFPPLKQQRFMTGLVQMDAQARTMHGKLLVQLAATQQDDVLAGVEAAAHGESGNAADTFWRDLKYLTMYGYYTSEIGIEQELATNRFPGRFEGGAEIAAVEG